MNRHEIGGDEGYTYLPMDVDAEEHVNIIPMIGGAIMCVAFVLVLVVIGLAFE